MRDILQTNWSVEPLLETLRDFRRIDDGSDLLAFHVVGVAPQRAVFVYLYGEDPDLIHYDLEDEAVDTGEWDHAVERGSVCCSDELRAVVVRWLS